MQIDGDPGFRKFWEETKVDFKEAFENAYGIQYSDRHENCAKHRR